MSNWTFLSNHGHVLFLLCREPDLRIRDIASKVVITERAVQRIIRDLVDGGYLVVKKEGRRNHYEPQLDVSLRHPLESGITTGQLMAGLQMPFESK